MAFNNYGNYSGPFQNQTPNYAPSQIPNQIPPQMPQQPMNQFEWVFGLAEANSYPLAPGHSVILMDSQDSVMYYKARESNGKYLPMDIYDLVKREKMPQVPQAQAQTQLDLSAYVRKDDLANIIAPLIQEAVDKALAN